MSDTPRTDSLLTELAVVKETDFAHIVRMTQRFADFTRSLERELAAERAKVEMLIGVLKVRAMHSDDENCPVCAALESVGEKP